MKNFIKTSVGVILLLAITVGSSLVSLADKGPAYQPTKAKEEKIAFASTALGEKRSMVVCSSILNIYGSEDLSGNVVATRSKGDIIEAATTDGLVYEVYANSGIVGYCRAGGLIYATTKTVAKLPVQWEIEGSSAAKRYTELTDVNEFAYIKDSGIKVSPETVLVQRDILLALSQISSQISRTGYTLSIDEGYGITDVPQDCPASSRSGALIRLSLVDSGGRTLKLSENPQLLALIEQAGLIRYEESDLFYSASHEKYMQINISVSDLVYVIYE